MAGEGEGEDGDVVFLAEALCGLGDGVRGAAADLTGAVEAEELAVMVLGLDRCSSG